MKLLVLLTLLLGSGCSLMVPKEKRLTSLEKIRVCIDDLLTNHGIELEKAHRVCEKIYRGR